MVRAAATGEGEGEMGGAGGKEETMRLIRGDSLTGATVVGEPSCSDFTASRS